MFFHVILVIIATDAQTYKWASLTDCGGNINATTMALCDNQDVFVVGKFTGETFFYSANKQDTMIKKIGVDGNDKSNFLACYDKNGKVKFVYKISGGQYLEIFSMLNYTDNSVLIFCNSECTININGEKGKTKDKTDAVGNVFRINSNGEIILAKKTKNAYVFNACSDLEGNVFCFYDQSKEYGKPNTIYKYDHDFNEVAEIEFEKAVLKTINCIKGKIYAVIQNTYGSEEMYGEVKNRYMGRLTIPQNHFAICELDFLNREIIPLKSWKIPHTINYEEKEVLLRHQAIISENAGKMYVNLFIYSEYLGFNFLDKRIKNKYSSSRVFQLGIDGSEKISEEFKGGYYNKYISAGKNGELFITFPITDSLKTEKKVVISEKYSQYTNEQVYIKLNQDLKTEWILKGGGTASVYNQSVITQAFNGNIYTLSNLYEFAKLESITLFPQWHSAYYISCIQDN